MSNKQDAFDDFGESQVAEIGDEFRVELENTWVFWFEQPDLKPPRALHNFKTVQGFWEFFNNIPAPDRITPKANLHVMIQGMEPKSDAKENINGGAWLFRLKNKESTAALWKELVLACVGEQFALSLEHTDEINGLTLGIRPPGNANYVQIWNRNTDEIARGKIFKKIKTLVPDINELTDFEYKSFFTENNKTNNPNNTRNMGRK